MCDPLQYLVFHDGISNLQRQMEKHFFPNKNEEKVVSLLLLFRKAGRKIAISQKAAAEFLSCINLMMMMTLPIKIVGLQV